MSKNKRLKMLAAALMVGSLYLTPGMQNPVMPVGLNTASAAGGAATERGQYIAIGAVDAMTPPANTPDGEKREFTDPEGNSYTYILTTVTDAENIEHRYWVRDGYTIKLEENKRHDSAQKTYVVSAYKGENADETGLLQTTWVENPDSGITTLNKKNLQNVNAGLYGAASNGGGTTVGGLDRFYIERNNQYVDVGGGSSNLYKNFKEATWNDDLHSYTYQGNVVSEKNLYIVNGKAGVFTTEENGNKIYTGSVYGYNNEILITAVSNGKYYSYWGAEITDPTATIGSMTVGQFNDTIGTINSNIQAVHGDNIKEIQVAQYDDNNGGTIALQTNGSFRKDEDGNLVAHDGKLIPGTISITSSGGTKGEDMKVTFSNTDENKQTHFFDVAVGSKVVANSTDTATGELSSVSINGQTYSITGGAINGNIDDKGNVSIQQGNKPAVTIGQVKDYVVSGGSISDGGTLTLNTTNKYTGDKGTPVTIEGVATKNDIENVNNNINNSSWKLTANNTDAINIKKGSTVDFSGAKDENGHANVVVSKENTENGAKVDFKLADDLNISNSVTTKNMYVTNVNEENKNSVTNVEYVTNEINNATTELTNKGFGIKAQDNNTVNKKLGESVEIVGSNSNISTSVKDGKVQVALNENVNGITSVNGFNIVNGFDNTSVNGENGMTLNIHNGNNGEGVTVNGVNIKQDTVSSLSNTTWDSNKDYSKSTNAATEAQLQQVSSVAQNANKGWYLSTNDGEKVNVKPDGVVDISNTDGNVAINNDGTNVTVDLNDKVTLGNEDGINVAIDGTKGTLEVNGISSTTKIEGDRITVGKDVTIDGGSQPSISVGGIKADGYTDVVTGLSNTKWNNQIAGKVKADDTEQSKAATQGQLSSVWDKANEASSEAGKHTTVTVNGGTEAEEGTYNADGNLQIKKTDNNGQTAYDVKLNDKVTLGNEDGINVAIDGTKGTLEVNGISSTTKIEGDRITVGKDVTIDGGSQPSISVGGIKADGYTDVVTGLSNTKWNNQIAGKVKADDTEQSKAATQGQLSSVWDKANEASSEAGKHTTVTVNGGTEAEEGTYNADGNLQIKKTDNNGQTAYDVKLNDKVTLGNEDGINVAIDGTKGTLEVNGISSTTKIEGDRITVGKDVTIDGGSQPNISVGGIKADGYTDTVTGLSNTKWNNQIAGKVKADETEQSKAATQGQLSSVWDKANEAGAEAAKHTTLSDGKNTTVSSTTVNGQTDYQVNLKDQITLGSNDNPGSITIAGTNGKPITIANNLVIGLANVDWTEAVKNNANFDPTQAATQGQLKDLDDMTVHYNLDANGNVDYENITLGKIGYESETRSGGTHLNNVAYATGKDGSEAVNVDYLKDTVDAAKEELTASDQHIQAGEYAPDENGKVSMPIVDNNGKEYGNVSIENVAKADDLGDVGNINEDLLNKDGSHTTVVDGLNNLNDKVDDIGDRVTNIEGDITDIKGNTITNGDITENGDINLKNDKGETQATVSGLTDSSLSDAKYDANKGELTLTTKDKYGNDADKNFTVGNIASKDDIKNINTVTGADSKENLQEQYKDTNFIKDADNMVDADKKLDQAVSDNRGAIINNANNISNLDRRVSDLDSRVNKVGALAVAMAGLHPLGYDPTAPTEFSAAVGNYKGETALAIGVFHHPNEDVLLSVGASIAGDETAVNAGATFRFGRRGHNPQEEAERKAREEAKLAAQKAAQEEAYRKTMQYKIQKALTYQDNSEAVSESTTEAKDASGDTQEFPNVDLDAQNTSSEANA